MATVQLSDVIIPSEFTNYLVQDSTEANALVQAGILSRNAVIQDQLNAGADSFTVPFWNDLADDEANIVNDDPTDNATPAKITTGKQVVRKAFLHKSWSNMNLASEIAGADALGRIQNRAGAYWNRQLQARLIASMNGIIAENAAGTGDMILDITAETGDAAKFSAAAVIDAAGTLGDKLEDLSGIAMHGDVYRAALKADLIEFIRPSDGSLALPTFRGLLVVQDDAMPYDSATGAYTTALFGNGAFGYGMSAPRFAAGTEVENLPSAGNGGGQQILHTRLNMAVAPAGYRWTEAAVLAESPSLSELADPANWERVVERKAVPLAFLVSKV